MREPLLSTIMQRITASMEYWGVDAADITAYLASPAVAYATAAGTWKQKIGTQAGLLSTTEVLKDGLFGEGWISPALMLPPDVRHILIFLIDLSSLLKKLR